jgi:pimeloyl-ACP methyl ester carboxylesterase
LGWDAERLWQNQIGALARAGWRVHAPDMRGVGQSVPLAGPVSIVDYADDISLLLIEAGITRPTLVGFSMGCVIATELALRPEVDACGLVLACGGLRSTQDGEAATEQMLALARDLGPDGFAQKQSIAIFGESYARNHPESVADFARWRAEMDQPSLHHAFRAGFGCDYESRLPDVPCPVSVIAADQDSFLSLASAHDLAAKAADARVHVIKDSGHMAPVEQPRAFTAALLTSLQEVRT